MSIAVTPATASVALGRTQQFTATGTYTDGSSQNLTASAAWTSSTPAVATVSGNGLATSVTQGSATITATQGAINGSATLTVTAPELTSIAVTPSPASVALGLSRQFNATGTYSDGSTQNLTASASWSSSLTGVATINGTGLATSVAQGGTTVTATSGTVSGTATLTVTPAELVTIAVTPASVINSPRPHTAIHRDGHVYGREHAEPHVVGDVVVIGDGRRDHQQQRVGDQRRARQLDDHGDIGHGEWHCDADGHGGAAGDACGVAARRKPRGRADVTVHRDRHLQRQHDTERHGVSTWTSSAPTFATISNAAGSQGRATGVAAGATTITATIGSIAGTSALTVTGTSVSLVSIAICRRIQPCQLGACGSSTATGTYSDNSTRAITTEVTWSSSNTNVATVSNIAGTQGLLRGVGGGSATITATLSGRSGTTTVTTVAAFAYVTLSSPDGIGGFGVSADGAPAVPLTGSPFGSATYPEHVVAAPSGRFVYVANSSNTGGNYRVSAYTVDGNTGALSPVQGSPYPVASYVRAAVG